MAETGPSSPGGSGKFSQFSSPGAALVVEQRRTAAASCSTGTSFFISVYSTSMWLRNPSANNTGKEEQRQGEFFADTLVQGEWFSFCPGRVMRDLKIAHQPFFIEVPEFVTRATVGCPTCLTRA